jgi:hypothetical protein
MPERAAPDAGPNAPVPGGRVSRRGGFAGGARARTVERPADRPTLVPSSQTESRNSGMPWGLTLPGGLVPAGSGPGGGR